MKKFAFILAFSFLGTLAVNATSSVVPASASVDQIVYCKVFNNTATQFEYKVGADVYTIDVNLSAGFAFEENTQILRKDTNGNWVNWFVFSSAYAGLTVQLSDLLGN